MSHTGSHGDLEDDNPPSSSSVDTKINGRSSGTGTSSSSSALGEQRTRESSTAKINSLANDATSNQVKAAVVENGQSKDTSNPKRTTLPAKPKSHRRNDEDDDYTLEAMKEAAAWLAFMPLLGGGGAGILRNAMRQEMMGDGSGSATNRARASAYMGTSTRTTATSMNHHSLIMTTLVVAITYVYYKRRRQKNPTVSASNTTTKNDGESNTEQLRLLRQQRFVSSNGHSGTGSGLGTSTPAGTNTSEGHENDSPLERNLTANATSHRQKHRMYLYGALIAAVLLLVWAFANIPLRGMLFPSTIPFDANDIASWKSSGKSTLPSKDLARPPSTTTMSSKKSAEPISGSWRPLPPSRAFTTPPFAHVFKSYTSPSSSSSSSSPTTRTSTATSTSQDKATTKTASSSPTPLAKSTAASTSKATANMVALHTVEPASHQNDALAHLDAEEKDNDPDSARDGNGGPVATITGTGTGSTAPPKKDATTATVGSNDQDATAGASSSDEGSHDSNSDASNKALVASGQRRKRKAFASFLSAEEVAELHAYNDRYGHLQDSEIPFVYSFLLGVVYWRGPNFDDGRPLGSRHPKDTSFNPMVLVLIALIVAVVWYQNRRQPKDEREVATTASRENNSHNSNHENRQASGDGRSSRGSSKVQSLMVTLLLVMLLLGCIVWSDYRYYRHVYRYLAGIGYNKRNGAPRARQHRVTTGTTASSGGMLPDHLGSYTTMTRLELLQRRKFGGAPAPAAIVAEANKDPAKWHQPKRIAVANIYPQLDWRKDAAYRDEEAFFYDEYEDDEEVEEDYDEYYDDEDYEDEYDAPASHTDKGTGIVNAGDSSTSKKEPNLKTPQTTDSQRGDDGIGTSVKGPATARLTTAPPPAAQGAKQAKAGRRRAEKDWYDKKYDSGKKGAVYGYLDRSRFSKTTVRNIVAMLQNPVVLGLALLLAVVYYYKKKPDDEAEEKLRIREHRSLLLQQQQQLQQQERNKTQAASIVPDDMTILGREEQKHHETKMAMTAPGDEAGVTASKALDSAPFDTVCQKGKENEGGSSGLEGDASRTARTDHGSVGDTALPRGHDDEHEIYNDGPPSLDRPAPAAVGTATTLATFEGSVAAAAAGANRESTPDPIVEQILAVDEDIGKDNMPLSFTPESEDIIAATPTIETTLTANEDNGKDTMPSRESEDVVTATPTIETAPADVASLELPTKNDETQDDGERAGDAAEICPTSKNTATEVPLKTAEIPIAAPPAQAPTPQQPLSPPVQLLCLTLSELFSVEVTVQAHDDAGAWGGHEWRPRPKASWSRKTYNGSRQQALTLVLHPHYQDYSDQRSEGSSSSVDINHSWTALLNVLRYEFSSLTSSAVFTSNAKQWSAALHIDPLVSTTTLGGRTTKVWQDSTWLRHLLSYHSRFTTMIRHNKYPTLVKMWMENNHKVSTINGSVSVTPLQVSLQHLADCLDVIRAWLMSHLVREVKPYLQSIDDDTGDEPMSGLFAEDYASTSFGNVAAPSTAMMAPYLHLASPLDLLPSLLESSSRTNSTDDFVTVDFVEDFLLQTQQIMSASTSPLTECSLTSDGHGKKAAPANSTAAAARLLLNRCVDRVQKVLHSPSQFQHTVLTARLLAVSMLLSISPSIRAIVPHALCDDKLVSGGKSNRSCSLRALWEAVAYVVPPVGSERHSRTKTNVTSAFYQHLDVTEDYPFNVFRTPDVSSIGKTKRDEVQRVIDESYSVMNSARTTVQSLLRVAFKYGDKHDVFHWLSGVVHQHESLVYLIKAKLSAPELESSRQFLLGFSSSLVCYCHTSLSKRLGISGAAAFDVDFIRNGFQGYYLEEATDTNRLFKGFNQPSQMTDKKSDDGVAPEQFDGATRFFFLTLLCFRVAVRTALRTESQFSFENQQFIANVENKSKSDKNGPRSPAEQWAYKPIMTAYLGWSTYFGDPELANALTEVSLMQLGWLVALATSDTGKDLSIVPDWMCREPARWIDYMANRANRLLKPTQADRAVEYATRLLDLGSSAAQSKGGRFTFSLMVTSALIDIISSFVQTSVRRATYKANALQRRQNKFAPLSSGGNTDNRDVDIYSSFDSNDSGVTVFTNELVQEKLCPTLVRTFVDASAVEGWDVEKDDGFTNFGQKSKIAELLCRLWFHPSGKFRDSFATISGGELVAFGAAAATAFAVDLNFGLEALTAVFTHFKQTRNYNTDRSGRHNAQTNHQVSQAVGMLMGARRFLWMLSSISRDDRVAASLGGAVKHLDATKFNALSGMLANGLEALTTLDGGTKCSLEDQDAEPTSKYTDMNAFEMLSSDAQKQFIHDVVRRRITSKTEYGLDVGNLCHVLLALFARWHLAAAKTTESGRRSSPLVEAVARIDDWDHKRATTVFERLVIEHELVDGHELDNAFVILGSDGHVSHERWELNYIQADALTEEQQRHRRTAAMDQIKRTEIHNLATTESVRLFLDDVEAAIPDRVARQRADVAQIPEFEETIFLSNSQMSKDDEYSSALFEWQVSSESFASSHGDGTTFAHYYDKAARSRGIAGSGKVLVKEARRCRKLLPDPSANSAIFVCFAEERMDLCRAIVTGPDETPYAHGLFVFDIYFPTSYPHVPPLVTLMTTGGGRVRFNPNLYVDGKVCLSLLGVTESSNNSQRWHKDESSLAQVLLSIQTQIFGVAEPYYNEGNGVSLALRDTREGNAGSRNYNRTIRLGTLRHAMIDMLRQPPVGFEDVVHRHFALCRQRVALQCQRWTLEEAVEAQRSRRREDELVHAKFQQVQADLLSLLVANPANGTYPSLAPLESDIQHVTRLDPQSAARLLRTSSTKLDKDDANNQKVSAAANMLMRDARLLALLQQQQRLEQQVAYNPSNPSNYNSQQQLDADGLLALQLQQEQRDSDRRHTEQERRQREREQRLVALQRQQAQAEPEDQPPEQQRPATEQQEPMSDAAPFNPWATTTSESTLPSSLTPTTSTSENQATANAEHGGSSAAGYTSDGDLYE